MVLRPFSRSFGRPFRTPFLTLLATSTALSMPLAALAGPVSVTTSTTTPLTTNTGDGQGPGNITVEANGTITVSAGVPLTVNSSNDVTVNGTLRNDLTTNATGILVNTNDANNIGRIITSNVTIGGLINLPGPDSSNVSATNNAGVRFQGNGTMNGNFVSTSGSQISLGGREGVGIAIDSIINGSFTSATAITAPGGGSIGIRSTRNVTGNFTVSGNIQTAGQDSIGVQVSGGVGGAVTLTSSIITGSQAFFDSNNKRVDAIQGGPAFWIASSIGNGVLLDGNQLTNAQEAVTPAPSGSTADSVLSTQGGTLGAFRVGPSNFTAPGNMIIGLREGTDSIIMRGRVQSSTSTLGKPVTAMVVSGAAGQSAILTGGIRNAGGNIDAVSIDSTATGIDIGPFAVVPYFYNAGSVIVTAADSTENILGTTQGTLGGAATGITIASSSTLGAFFNTGVFTVDSRGRSFTSTGLVDNSGTLTYFENTGTFQTLIKSYSTGRTIAADLSRSTRNIDFRNSGTLIGDVTFGSGNDSFLSTAGTVTGNYAFGAGNDNVTIRNTTFTGGIDLGTGNHSVVIDSASKFSGGIARGAGTTTLSVVNSDIAITGGRRIDITSGNISGTSTVDISIDNNNASLPLIQATGRLVIDPTVKISSRLSGLITQSQTVTVISAGDLQLGVPISQLSSASSSYIYGFQYRIAPTNRNQVLLDVTRRSAAQLGLARNLGALYENSLTALAADNELFSTIAATTNKAGFESIMTQLQPDSSDATLYAAQRTQSLAYGVIRSRLAGIQRTTGQAAGTDYSSFWIQQLGSYGKRDAEAEQPGYKIYSVGIATGIDTQFTPNLKGGMSLTQVWSLPHERNTNDRASRVSSTQLDFYGRHQNGASYTQAIFGGAYDTFKSDRRVIVNSITREAIGKWSGYHMGGAVDTGATFRVGDFKLTPYARGAYIRTNEKSYSETGGGNGVNLTYDKRNQDSMRAGAGFIAQRRFVIFQDVGIEAEFRGDLAHELSADPANVIARFTSGGPKFTTIGQTPDKNVFGAGLSLGVRDIFTSLSLDYDAEKSGGFLGHTIAATFRFRF